MRAGRSAARKHLRAGLSLPAVARFLSPAGVARVGGEGVRCRRVIGGTRMVVMRGSPAISILLAKSNIAEMRDTILLRYRLFLAFVRRRLTK